MRETLENVIAQARNIWRYHWHAMGVAWLIVLVGWVAVHYIVVPKYEASAQIYIDTESVLEPLLKGLTLEVNQSEQLGLMARQLLSRPNLEHVVQQIDFDREVLSPRGVWPERLDPEKLKSHISLQADRTDRDAKVNNVYSISYTDRNPQLAEQVVQALIDAFTANTIAEIRQDAARAKKFIDKRLADYKKQLTISETQLQEFKRQHFDVLPKEGQDYFARLQQEQAALDEVELDIRQTESRRRELQAQLQDIPRVVRATLPDGTPVLTSLESRILTLRKKLDELRLKFTEMHPDVIETKASLAELEQQQNRGGGFASTIGNPLYQELELALKKVEGELAALRTRHEAYDRRVKTLQQQLETLTQVEEELQTLVRNYDIDRANYKDMMTRQQSMEMSESVEQNREDLKFRVIEPPKVPLESIRKTAWQKQLAFIIGVLAAGIGGGLGFAYMLSQIHPTIYNQRTLSELTELPVFASISRVPTLRERVRKGLDLTTFAATGLMMVLAFGITLYVQHAEISDTNLVLDIEGIVGSLDAGSLGGEAERSLEVPGNDDKASPGGKDE
jgi:polysaccharide chain length determinant protein (PEP-CTERM system associated)